MPMSKAAKHDLRTNLATAFNESAAAIVAEYRGLTMGELSELRQKLRESEATFKVLKNRVAKKAIENEAKGAEPLADALTGPVGVAFVKGDPASAAKTILDFQKEKKDTFKVTAGLMDGKALSDQEIKAIADLPSREQLMASIVGSLVSPHRGLLGVLNGVPRQLVQVINAIKDTKS